MVGASRNEVITKPTSKLLRWSGQSRHHFDVWIVTESPPRAFREQSSRIGDVHRNQIRPLACLLRLLHGLSGANGKPNTQRLERDPKIEAI